MNRLWVCLVIIITLNSCGKLTIIEEEFTDNTGNWPVVTQEKSPNFYSEIKDGKYIFKSNIDNGHNYTFRHFLDFDRGLSHDISTSIKVDFAKNNNPCGLLWGGNQENILNGYYFFGYKSDGTILISRENSAMPNLAKTYFEEKSEFLKVDDFNLLEIKREETDGVFEFYINGNKIHEEKPIYVIDSGYGFLTFSSMEIENLNINYSLD